MHHQFRIVLPWLLSPCYSLIILYTIPAIFARLYLIYFIRLSLETHSNDIDDFNTIANIYFENLKQEMKNIKGSLKLAMIEFFVAHKTETDNNFFIKAMDGLKAPIIEILSLGKKQGRISYENLNEATDLVFYWLIGLEEIMLSTNVPIENLYSQIDLMKQLILSGHLD